jgi:hypothetical protein
LSLLRSDGSRDNQAGEAGPVEQSSGEAKSLKTKVQGTIQLLLKWAAAEAARRGPVGQIKGYSHNMFPKEKESWKQLFVEAQKGKKQPPKEKASRLKKDAYSKLQGL